MIFFLENDIELRIVNLLKGNEGPPQRFDPERNFNNKQLANERLS
ncbi:MAG: hypothetical protein ACR2F1_01625 [Nitrososphaeraceae archaeon]